MLNLETEELKLLEKYPIKSQDGLMKKSKVILKIFNPYGRGTWYILGAEKMYDGKDYLCFGYVESPLTPSFNEYGYFTLKELMEVNIPVYITVNKEEIFLGNGNLEVDKYLKKGILLEEASNEVKY